MIILDTCALIYDALEPQKLGRKAKQAIDQAAHQKTLYCLDISLWEVAMLVQKKRLQIDIDTKEFLELCIQAREINLLKITADIAALSVKLYNKHTDPADCLIAAAAIYNHSALITCDKKLQQIENLITIW